MRMRTITAVLLVLLLWASNGYATGSPFLVPAHNNRPLSFPETPKRPFIVTAYNVLLDWRTPFAEKTQRFSAATTLTVQLTQVSTEIMLDAGLLVMDSVFINGEKQLSIGQPQNEHLAIPLPVSLQQQLGQNITITIYYHREATINLGMYFFPKGTYSGFKDRNNDSIFTAEDVAYTMSEPVDAHYWMPCLDDPSNKAQSEISIIAPNGIVTVSNGDLIEKVGVDAASTLWHWKSDRPITTYLMAATASNYISWHEPHARVTDPGDTVDLVFYAWPVDYNDTSTDRQGYNARLAFHNTGNIMAGFETKYGAYPFKKYGQVPVDPFYFGGMEHQSVSTLNRFWLRGNEQGMAHEMAHQWFGDKTTCRTFKDIWLNEGFATFSEALWGESWGGNEWYMNIIRGKASDYFNGDGNNPNNVPIYDPAPDKVFNGSTTYAKAACVIHMIRRMVGNDTLFFNALTDYTNAFAYSTVTTDEFTSYMSSRLHRDLSEYIDQWIYGYLHPDYNIGWWQNTNHTLGIRIAQLQSNRDHYTMPVRFFAFHGSQVDTIVIDNTQRSQTFYIPTTTAYDSLQFDDDAVILSEVDLYRDPALKVAPAASQAPSLSVVLLPKNQLRCEVPAHTGGDMKIVLYNTIGGRCIERTLNDQEQSVVLDLSPLPSGAYIVTATSAGGVMTAKIVLSK